MNTHPPPAVQSFSFPFSSPLFFEASFQPSVILTPLGNKFSVRALFSKHVIPGHHKGRWQAEDQAELGSHFLGAAWWNLWGAVQALSEQLGEGIRERSKTQKEWCLTTSALPAHGFIKAQTLFWNRLERLKIAIFFVVVDKKVILTQISSPVSCARWQ